MADVEQVVEDVDLVVVDSATGLYRVEEEAGEYGSDREDSPLQRLSRQIVHLTSLARRYDVAVVVTNQVYTDPEREEYSGLGGNAMEHWTKTIVRLERLDGERRLAVVEKSQSSADGRSAEFRITSTGVEATEGFDGGSDAGGRGAESELADDDENKTNNTSV